MSNFATDEKLLRDLSDHLKCYTLNLQKLKVARVSLNMLQNRKTFAMLGFKEPEEKEPEMFPISRKSSHHHSKVAEEMGEEEFYDECFESNEDKWLGHFNHFEILNDPPGLGFNENKNTIELTNHVSEANLKQYLRNGTRSFMIDLSYGAQKDCQSLILRLRESELAVSHEFAFPVVSTLFARITSRYQYTGRLIDNPDGYFELTKGDRLVLTTHRNYSDKCNNKVIYVNGRFLINDVKVYDFILVGYDIQLLVLQVFTGYVCCCVARGGQLRSRLPVLFPSRCSKFRISQEELEDITFAKEVGINVIVSDIIGTTAYLKDLQRIMALLECEHLRLYTRVVLNRMHGCDGEFDWVVQQYDGFLVELAPPEPNEDAPLILHLCPNAECFIKLAYESKKPIIFDATPIGDELLRVEPEHYFHVFYYPDKYFIRCPKSEEAFYFSFLQSSIFDTIPHMTLSSQPFCDESHTGADAMARAAVAASFELGAQAIIVCGTTERMVQKVAHYRPTVPIVFISQLQSIEDYVSLYHNVFMLPFCHSDTDPHEVEVYKKTLYGITYLVTRKLLKQDQHVIIVYSAEEGTTFLDKYVAYKFDLLHFRTHLKQSLFASASSGIPEATTCACP